MDRRSLPSTWQAVTFGDLGTEVRGSEQPTPGRQYALYSVPAFPSGKPDIVDGSQIGSSKRPVLSGDLLLCKINPRINRVWAVGPAPDDIEQLASTEYLVFRPHDPDVLNWLLWYLRSPRFRSWIEANVEGATGSHTRAKSAPILRQPVPLAPPADRSRILSTLERHMSGLDEAGRSLAQVQAGLALYRSSWLASAILEPDPQQGLGELGIRLAGAELDGVTPGNWRRAAIGEIATVHVGSTPSRSQSSYWGGSIPWVSSGEVRFGRIHATRECLTERGYRSSSVELHPPGTVLLAMIGEGRTRGQAAILDIAATTNQNVAAIRLTDREVIPEWLFLALMASYQRTRTLGSGNNQPALSKARVSEMEVPLPPMDIQRQLASEFDARLSIIDSVDAAIRANERRQATLRALLLRMAFDGGLDDVAPPARYQRGISDSG
jgi:type I restriction enzyme S subunit